MTDWPAWATETVEVRPPDPAWHDNGEREREALQASLEPWLLAPVEHVGSTAVPGLAAEPILDLQAAASNLDAVPRAGRRETVTARRSPMIGRAARSGRSVSPSPRRRSFSFGYSINEPHAETADG